MRTPIESNADATSAQAAAASCDVPPNCIFAKLVESIAHATTTCQTALQLLLLALLQ
eukprot:CAMPEP_0172728822 /NCGR_PEP_ID=MMETSP1074-20121228/92850_1 /TAXON_ID=2916 /ORGANISM="Ceratium fusus, Strain PA161109" /LENGTH=56 /DNA_ID=CAMNT_0013556123 /DNA_START=103 /DNA_END=270 /DNA_ORIENTATION=+